MPTKIILYNYSGERDFSQLTLKVPTSKWTIKKPTLLTRQLGRRQRRAEAWWRRHGVRRTCPTSRSTRPPWRRKATGSPRCNSRPSDTPCTASPFSQSAVRPRCPSGRSYSKSRSPASPGNGRTRRASSPPTPSACSWAPCPPYTSRSSMRRRLRPRSSNPSPPRRRTCRGRPVLWTPAPRTCSALRPGTSRWSGTRWRCGSSRCTGTWPRTPAPCGSSWTPCSISKNYQVHFDDGVVDDKLRSGWWRTGYAAGCERWSRPCGRTRPIRPDGNGRLRRTFPCSRRRCLWRCCSPFRTIPSAGFARSRCPCSPNTNRKTEWTGTTMLLRVLTCRCAWLFSRCMIVIFFERSNFIYTLEYEMKAKIRVIFVVFLKYLTWIG